MLHTMDELKMMVTNIQAALMTAIGIVRVSEYVPHT